MTVELGSAANRMANSINTLEKRWWRSAEIPPAPLLNKEGLGGFVTFLMSTLGIVQPDTA